MSIRAASWANKICEKSDIPPQLRAVLNALCFYHDSKTGNCFPSYQTISDITGYRKRGVIDYVAELEANGLISIIRRYEGREQKSNQYTLFGKRATVRWATPQCRERQRGVVLASALVGGCPPVTHDLGDALLWPVFRLHRTRR